MSVTVFVDETKQDGYLVTAAALVPDDIARARKAIRALVMPGQRRLHFLKESDRQRKQILDVIYELAPNVRIYDGSTHPRRQQRNACLSELLSDLASQHARLLVIEREDAVLTEDRKLLYRRVRELGCEDTLQYRHQRAREEPLLAIPDAFGWCWHRGGHWKTRIAEMTAAVRRV